ncbi:MAG TPA: ribosomal protein L7/L12 [Steroidobacteraceae bacterium]|jgi:hypothetical protein
MSKYQVRLRELPADRVALVRALRLIGNLRLKQADDLARHLDRYRKSVVVAGIDEPTAGHIAAALRTAGGEVAVEPSSIDTPMLCTPTVNARFAWRGWGPVRVIRPQ